MPRSKDRFMGRSILKKQKFETRLLSPALSSIGRGRGRKIFDPLSSTLGMPGAPSVSGKREHRKKRFSEERKSPLRKIACRQQHFAAHAVAALSFTRTRSSDHDEVAPPMKRASTGACAGRRSSLVCKWGFHKSCSHGLGGGELGPGERTAKTWRQFEAGRSTRQHLGLR